jgi:sulfopyruvate decarboxylase subunit beta
MALDRYETLVRLAAHLPKDALVMSTYIGAVSFEWGAITEEHPQTAQLGQMGDVIGMAVGLALALPHRKIACIDGDGSVLMELGQLVVMGQEAPANLAVFVIDNGVYESIGSGPGGPRSTATAGKTDLAAIARGCGVPHAVDVATAEALERELGLAFSQSGCRLINIRTRPSHARVPPRQSDGFESKYRFVRHVEKLEGKQILQLARQDRQLMKK